MIDAQSTLDTVEADPGTGTMLGDPLPFLHGWHTTMVGGGARRLPIEFPRTPLPVRNPLPGIAPPNDYGPGVDPMPPPRSILPIIRRDPFQGIAPPTDTEGTVEAGTGLNNAGGWAGIAGGFGPSQSVLDAIDKSANSGGANMMLGPQFGFAPADSGSAGGGGGGSSPLLLVGVLVVGILLWLHFRKKHAHSEG